MIYSPKVLLVIVLATGMLAGCGSPAPSVAPTATTAPTAVLTIEPTDMERQVMVGDVERSYLLHIPPGVDSGHAVPVVFAFHGLGAEPSSMQLLTGFDDIADQSGFLVVYPEGIGLSWNAGTCCGYASEETVDEPAFIRGILSDLGNFVSVDAKRIYATGFSNGGGLMYRLACEMSDTFAAVAPVAGAMLYSPCRPEQPVSLVTVHGLADLTAPYIGGGELDVPPVEDVIGNWARLDGCSSSPIVDNPIKIIKHTAYTSCKAGTAVELYAVEGGGHAWVSKYVYPLSEKIWDFFAAHPKQ